ncbi:hypothetical protein H4Q26_013633 [Puccinia striiformis f. sp. tritici PST-130]|nr:hypothetical protein H4Q26_013633 [Puccinia striiformis f. sp. tritici PST-130]
MHHCPYFDLLSQNEISWHRKTSLQQSCLQQTKHSISFEPDFSELLDVQREYCFFCGRSPRKLPPSKSLSSYLQEKDGTQLDDHELTAICPPTGGVLSQSASVALKIERGDAKNVYKFDQPVCSKEKCPLTRSDCLSAFYQLPTNAMESSSTGRGEHQSLAPPAETVQSPHRLPTYLLSPCEINFARLKHLFRAVTNPSPSITLRPRQFILPTMKKLINDCDEHRRYESYNGDIWLSARAANRALCE